MAKRRGGAGGGGGQGGGGVDGHGRSTAAAEPAASSLGTFAFYLTSFFAYLYVWCWHFSKDAQRLPGARGYGWFTRYLTYWGMSFQVMVLFFCVLCQMAPKLRGLHKFTNVMACAAFGVANVVTVMNAVLHVALRAPVEGADIPRPWWLSIAVHYANAAVAWADVFASRRTFPRASFHLAVAFAVAYTTWISVCYVQNGVYPYPFLNNLPQPQGFTLVVVAASAVLFAVLYLGSAVAHAGDRKRMLAAWKGKLN
eukprot:jgi/Chlat1/6767/Chrsp50S00503